jgi:hypothetical protein
MQRVYIDVESCGLYGVPVILQYAIDDGPVQIHEFWRVPIYQSMQLIEELLCKNIVVGFNLAFDWFHICKIYTIFEAYGKYDTIPEDDIPGLAKVERQARDGSCVKPAAAMDLFLHAKKTDLQITMDRGDVRVRRVPTVLAWDLAKLLDSKITLDPILFAGRKKKYAPRFVVYDIKQTDGTMHPTLKDVVLKFRPSASLKAIAEHKLGADTVLKFQDIELDRTYWPKEVGYAPFHDAADIKPKGKTKRKVSAGRTQPWPKVLSLHISHWAFNDLARKYAQDDITYTRGLDKLWGCPTHSDDDSVLACSVAACRWKGYRLNIEQLKGLIQYYREKEKFPTAPNRVREYIKEVCNRSSGRPHDSTRARTRRYSPSLPTTGKTMKPASVPPRFSKLGRLARSVSSWRSSLSRAASCLVPRSSVLSRAECRELTALISRELIRQKKYAHAFLWLLRTRYFSAGTCRVSRSALPTLTTTTPSYVRLYLLARSATRR